MSIADHGDILSVWIRSRYSFGDPRLACALNGTPGIGARRGVV
jgi:hypothetical protein